MKTTLYSTLALLTFVTLIVLPNSFAQSHRPLVRCIYFIPADNTPNPAREVEIRQVIKGTQQFYADEMQRHGYGRKTFQLETDTNGEIVVHQVRGKFNTTAYVLGRGERDIHSELPQQQFDRRNFHYIFTESTETLEEGTSGIGSPYFDNLGGNAIVHFLSVPLAAHELGHAFGLSHDWRNRHDIMTYYRIGDGELSKCAAEWLDVHRAFNPAKPDADAPLTVNMLPPRLESLPNVIRLRFEVTDLDGVQQVQLIGSTHWQNGDPGLIACKSAKGNSNNTVEFIFNPIERKSDVTLSVIDIYGNLTWSITYPIDITVLVPNSEPILFPDPNLAAAVRETLNLNSSAPITQLDMISLTKLDAQYSQIADLRGLEHAVSLKELSIRRLETSDLTPLVGLTHLKILQLYGHAAHPINDFTFLTGLTHLETLTLSNTGISDLTPLAGLTYLWQIDLSLNQISDLTPLAKLRYLWSANLQANKISDVTPLMNVATLRHLYLQHNLIQNRKPLLEMLRQNPDMKIYLSESGEPLPVTLSTFRAEHTNAGVLLRWITQSELDNAGFYIYRSKTKNGDFKVVNASMIQGAGTTAERNEYTWTDTTAKSNTVYYYRIEDVSHAGVRKQLATVRLRGLVSASGKFTTRWADLKMLE